MRATDLTPAQRQHIFIAAVNRREYFGRLRKRMDALAWDPGDPAYLAVVAARDALQAVVHALHQSRPPDPPVVREKKWAHRDAPPDEGPADVVPMPDLPWVGKAKSRKRRR